MSVRTIPVRFDVIMPATRRNLADVDETADLGQSSPQKAMRTQPESAMKLPRVSVDQQAPGPSTVAAADVHHRPLADRPGVSRRPAPPTNRLCPVIPAARSLAANTAVRAKSPELTCWRRGDEVNGPAPSTERPPGNAAGKMALTRMPSGPNSTAKVLVNPTTAHLKAVCAAQPGAPCKPVAVDRLRMHGPPCTRRD